MRYNSVYFLFFGITLCCAFGLKAQDAHLSQFYAAPIMLNPGLTGNFDGSYRLAAVYRDQWRSVMDHPFRTFAASFDMRQRLSRRSQTPDMLGFGVAFLADRADHSRFSTTSVLLSGAFHKALNTRGTNYLSFGIAGGINQRGLIYDNLVFNDQFNGVDGYTDPSSENLPNNSVVVPDFGAGVFWNVMPTPEASYHLGFSVQHFHQPNISFYGESSTEIPLYMKINAQAGAQWQVTRGFHLIPRLLASWQGPYMEYVAGINGRFSLGEFNEHGLYLGVWSRPVHAFSGLFDVDAVIYMAGIELGALNIGLSYDMNVSGLARASSGFGAFEVSVIYMGDYSNESVMCPRF